MIPSAIMQILDMTVEMSNDQTIYENKVDIWPPPDWAEVIILWTQLLGTNTSPHVLYDWANENSVDKFHVSGHQVKLMDKSGFSFRFKNPQDATAFTLKWAQ